MLDACLLESLEAISQDNGTRRVLLTMAAISQAGRVQTLLAEITRDRELDDLTKLQLSELAQDRVFLLAFEEYARRTERLH